MLEVEKYGIVLSVGDYGILLEVNDYGTQLKVKKYGIKLFEKSAQMIRNKLSLCTRTFIFNISFKGYTHVKVSKSYAPCFT